MAVLYDDAYIAEEERHAQAQRAQWEAQRLAEIAKHGSEEAYEAWVLGGIKKLRRDITRARARDRAYRAQTIHLVGRPAIAHRRMPPCSRPRPRVKRTSSSSRTSSADPGDGKPRPAVLTFACLTAAERGEA